MYLVEFILRIVLDLALASRGIASLVLGAAIGAGASYLIYGSVHIQAVAIGAAVTVIAMACYHSYGAKRT